MSSYPRVLRFPFAALLLSCLAVPAASQQKAPVAPAADVDLSQVDHTAWLYRGSDIAPDPEWHFGTLPNGLRFAVRRNGVPPGQVSVRVRVDAGSLNENDSERGFAHFIEHLTFRGSEYVPDGEAKRTWQRMGTVFGSDTNAQTTPVGTTYKLDLPSATDASLDESIKILSGMMEKPNINPTALDAERPIVLSEQRAMPGPAVRFNQAMQAAFFAGQPFADRSPIGNIKTLEAATAPAVEAFHDRWYRPERTVVIISGDMDPALFERLIVKYFSGWQGIGPKPAETDFGKPDPSAPTTSVLVEPGLPAGITMAVLRPWHFNNDTILFNQNRMVDQIALAIIDRRLETRARAGGSFLAANADLDDPVRSANWTTVSITPLGDNWAAALKDVRAVIADAEASPPTQAEIDRELAALDAGLRSQVEQSRVEAASKQADDFVSALDIRETVTTPANAYNIFRDARAKGMFNPARMVESTKRLFQGDATRVLLNVQAPDPNATAELTAVLKADVKGLAGKRVAQAAVTFAQLPKLGPSGKVVSRETISGLGVERVTFANGVRLLVYSQHADSGRVFVQVRFGGGYNAIPADRPTPTWAAPLALMQGGIGKLDEGDLDTLAAGRSIGLQFGIDDDAFTLAAMSSPTDYPDQLKLFAAKLAMPGWDPHPIARAKAAMLASYAGADASPDAVLSQQLEGLLHDGDPRWTTPTPDQVRALTPEAFKAFWAPRLASGPIEVSVFGDMEAEAAIKAVADTFGAMKPRTATTTPVPPIHFPAHDTAPVERTHQGAENQAEAVIAWPTGAGIDGISDSRELDVLAQIFTDRLFEKLRQGAGVSYSPNVSSNWPIGAPGGGRIVAMGQVPPDKIDYFFTLARQIAADLATKPVDPDELQRILGPTKQAVLRASSSSQFWMLQLAGSTFDPKRIDATRNIGRDYATITAAGLQALAAKYLKPETEWTMAVRPKAAVAVPQTGAVSGKR